MRRFGAVLAVLTVTVGAAACSSSKSSSGSGASTTAPEDRRASAADVASGLGRIKQIAADVASNAGTDKSKAKDLDGQIEPAWQTIEGTVKANDQDAYLTFEDAFAVLEQAADKGDATKAQQGAASVANAVTAYLAKFPG